MNKRPLHQLLKNLLLVALVSIQGFSFAQIGGYSTYKFLDLPTSAREAALGGTLITGGDFDIGSTLNNPALISPKMNGQLALNYVSYLADINYGYVATAQPIKGIGTVVFGMQYVNYGKFNEADPTGLITGSFTPADYSFNMGYAKQLDSNFTCGGTLKTIYSHLDQYTSIGSAIDLALTYSKPEKFLASSLMIKGIGYQWTTYVANNHEPLPFQIQWAISKKLPKAPFRFTLTATHLERWDLTYVDSVNIPQVLDPTQPVAKPTVVATFADQLARHMILSVEAYLGQNFVIRLAYNYQRQQELKLVGYGSLAGFSLGAGIKVSRFTISYGYAQYTIGAGSNHISISTNLNELYRRKS